MQKRIKYIFFFILVLIGSKQLSAQYFYDQEKEEKEFVYSFYERGHKFSAFALGSPWQYKVGGAVMVHLNKDKVSPYFEYKTSLYDRYVVNGADVLGTSIRQKEISYTQYTIASGCGFSFHRNFVAFVKAGVSIQESYADSQIDDGFKYDLKNQGIDMNIGGGIAFISNKYVSLLIAGDIESKQVYFGAGLTF